MSKKNAVPVTPRPPDTVNLYVGVLVPIPKLAPYSFDETVPFASILKRGKPEILFTLYIIPLDKLSDITNNLPEEPSNAIELSLVTFKVIGLLPDDKNCNE